MKILAIDTSSSNCSVSIVEVTENKNFNVLITQNNDDAKTHSQKLMPMIDEAFTETSLSLDDINLLACCLGPGSFTGIRIGIATAKAFADVKNIPTVGVTSLESLAYNVNTKSLICPIIDCKNKNVYSALFCCDNNSYSQIGNNITENINEALDIVTNYIKNCNNSNKITSDGIVDFENNLSDFKFSNFDNITFIGDGSILYKGLILNKFENIIKNPTTICDENTNSSSGFSIKFSNDNIQSSISLAKCAYDKYLKGIYGDSNSIFPLYLRKSQAERQQLEK